MTGTGELRRGGRRGDTAGPGPGPGRGPRPAAGTPASGLRRRSPNPSVKRGSAPLRPRGPSRCSGASPRWAPLLGLGVPLPGTLCPALRRRGSPAAAPAAVRGAEPEPGAAPEGRDQPRAGPPGQPRARSVRWRRVPGGCGATAARGDPAKGGRHRANSKAVLREMVRKNLFTQVVTDFSCLLFVVPRPAGASHSRMTQSSAPLFRQGAWGAVACSMLHGDGTGKW